MIVIPHYPSEDPWESMEQMIIIMYLKWLNTNAANLTSDEMMK